MPAPMGEWWVCLCWPCDYKKEYEGESSHKCEGDACPLILAGAPAPDCVLQGGEGGEE